MNVGRHARSEKTFGVALRAARVIDFADWTSRCQCSVHPVSDYSPPVSGGVVQANPMLLVNDIPISLVSLGVNNGVLTLGGDISAFAGTTCDHYLSTSGNSGLARDWRKHFHVGRNTVLDSSSPEPGVSVFVGFGAAFVGLTRRRNRRKAFQTVPSGANGRSQSGIG